MAETAAAPDWQALEAILARYLAETDAALADCGKPSEPALRAASREASLTAAKERVTSLPDTMSALSGKLAELDNELRDVEDGLRRLAAETETVRRNLASWAGRAIG
ncbi:MAG: hypothetical protein NZO58_13395 [Gemmataceae bacterium]|nr:hypothetical protein [Gemmataceae bacterium]